MKYSPSKIPLLSNIAGTVFLLLMTSAGYAQMRTDNTALSVLYRVWIASKNDSMMTTNPAERAPGTFEGQMFYIPQNFYSGTHPLYRLFWESPLKFDHMDSLVPDEGGFFTEGIHGYPFDQQVVGDGTSPIHRWYNRTTGDHLTGFESESALSGYNRELLLGYGYQRFGNSGEKAVTIAGSQTKVRANLVAGGIVSELWWRGKQFVNNSDYGRQIQITVHPIGLDPYGRSNSYYNPTEGGDTHTWPNVVRDPALSHGSPLISYSKSRSVLQTHTKPLQWIPECCGGGINNPVLWNGTFSKKVVLDFERRPNIIQWTSTINLPTPEPTGISAEVVTAYLNAEFSRFLMYNASTRKLTDMSDFLKTPGSGIDPEDHRTEVNTLLRPDVGAGILATSDGHYALGIYYRRKHPSDGSNPNTSGFAFYNFNHSNYSDKYSGDASKIALVWRSNGGFFEAGSRSFTAYLCVGTLDRVISEINWLAAKRR